MAPPSPPPDEPPPDRPRPPELPGTPLRAVLTGMSIDICGSTLLGYVIAAVYKAVVLTPDMTDEQVATLLENFSPSLGFVFVVLGLQSLVSVLAGYAAARIVHRDEIRIGAITGVASVLVGLALDGGGTPGDLSLLYILCDLACVLLGAKYGAEHNRRLEAPAREPADASTP